jgi:flagellar assembly protein FliH
LYKIIRSSSVIIDEKKFKLNYDFKVPKSDTISEEIKKEDGPDISYDFEQEYEDMLEQVNAQAREIIHMANTERESIISEGIAQASQITEEARHAGYIEGYNIGHEEGKNYFNTQIAELLNVKESYLKKKKEIELELEPIMIEIIKDSIKKILTKHIENDSEYILDLVSEGLKKTTFTENITIRVSTKDYPVIKDKKEYIKAMTQNIDEIIIKEDPALLPGSLVIDTISGSIDSSINTQLDSLNQLFDDLLKVMK